MKHRKLFLIGPMGAGKTTIGRRLAGKLALDFVDSDHEIEARTGVDIPFIFEKEGECGFRQREAQVIDELTQRDALVLATGGGAVTNADSRRHLAARGVVIYLHADVDQQLLRTAADHRRPLLQSGDRRGKLSSLFAEREPLYRAIADIIVCTNGQRATGVCRDILAQLNALGR